MTSFKTFLLEYDKTTRLQHISARDAIHWMDQHAKKYLETGIWIWRGLKAADTSIVIGNPAGQHRISAGTPNFYTLWFDNRNGFDEFPLRSESFVCATHRGTASDYGAIFLVVPKDTAKFGVVGKSDIWDLNVGTSENPITLVSLNEGTSAIFTAMNMDQPDTYSELIAALKEVTLEKVRDAIIGSEWPVTWRCGVIRDIMVGGNFDTLYDLWAHGLKPSLFTTIRAGDLESNPPYGEVWTDSECLFIPFNDLELSDEDMDLMQDFVNQYEELKGAVHWPWLMS